MKVVPPVECNKTANREQLDFELHFNAFVQEDRIAVSNAFGNKWSILS